MRLNSSRLSAKAGRGIPKGKALDHVAGYSIANEGSIRDYQMKTSQWMIGKSFDNSGSFGPEIVTPDELPEGRQGPQNRSPAER